MRSVTMAACLLAVGFTVHVGAQDAGGTKPVVLQAEDGRWLQLRSSRGETVSVETVSRTKTTGTLLGVEAESLSVGLAGVETRVERDRVRRVTCERRDSVKNGVIAGAVLGAGMAAGSSCNVHNRKCGARGRTAFIALGAAIWAVIGEAIDSSVNKRVTLYEAPREPATSTHPR